MSVRTAAAARRLTDALSNGMVSLPPSAVAHVSCALARGERTLATAVAGHSQPEVATMLRAHTRGLMNASREIVKADPVVGRRIAGTMPAMRAAAEYVAAVVELAAQADDFHDLATVIVDHRSVLAALATQSQRQVGDGSWANADAGRVVRVAVAYDVVLNETHRQIVDAPVRPRQELPGRRGEPTADPGRPTGRSL